ncbi:pyruvate dehydrogenase complex E1 component subunit beta, partial [Cereibacter sphaeroides]|nr:pyruvate dehydrogenase complex E1 component subunit beta [Cereibacter sphaeroides]
ATMEFEAVDEGTVGKILIAEGTAGVKVNTPIAVLVEEGESAEAAAEAPAQPERKTAPAEASEAKALDEPLVSSPGAPVPGKRDRSPDWPEGTAMKTMTVREALREAMAEEMRRDGTVFLMGEEVGEYQGAYKISQGLLDEFGAKRVVDTPITEHGFAG